jgi:hypothetical protein
LRPRERPADHHDLGASATIRSGSGVFADTSAATTTDFLSKGEIIFDAPPPMIPR